MAFIADYKQLELFSPITVDENIFRMLYDYVYGRIRAYLPLINSSSLRPILQKAKWVVRCKELDNIALSISILKVDISGGVIPIVLSFPFHGFPIDIKTILAALKSEIGLKEDVPDAAVNGIRGQGFYFRVPIPEGYEIIETNVGGNGRRQYRLKQ